MSDLMRRLSLSCALLIVASFVGAGVARADDLIRCRVRIDTGVKLVDAEGRAPTTEEASEWAVENACALACSVEEPEAPESAAKDSPEGGVTEAPSGEETSKASVESVSANEEASDDASGLESCVAACTEVAVTMGLLCLEGEELVYVEGVFDESSEDASKQDEAQE